MDKLTEYANEKFMKEGYKHELKISMGAMSPKISKQMGETAIPKKKLQELDRLCDAATLLYIQQIITSKEVDNARRRIIKKLQKLIDQYKV